MADNTHIEWTDATWNPITGCKIVSPGCTNCYAMGLAGTRLKHIPSRAGLTIDTKAGPVWTGEVRLNEAWLTQPLKWRRRRKIFVCAHGDLFAEGVPDEWIDRVFAVMALAPHHTFQVLTKRPARMRAYIARLEALREGFPGFPAERNAAARLYLAAQGLDWFVDSPGDAAYLLSRWPGWPLPNVWLGVSAEDQRRANERIPELLATPAAVRFVSAEPLLGPIELRQIEHKPGHFLDALTGMRCDGPLHIEIGAALDWVIVGGESGPKARPMHPAWARTIRDRCAAEMVAFHFKQHGAWLHMPERAHFKDLAPEPWKRVPAEMPGVRPALMFRMGKKAAGRHLDGRTHDGMPEARA